MSYRKIKAAREAQIVELMINCIKKGIVSDTCYDHNGEDFQFSYDNESGVFTFFDGAGIEIFKANRSDLHGFNCLSYEEKEVFLPSIIESLEDALGIKPIPYNQRDHRFFG
jgi:hypothetical protein